jgi:hypothetical protein
MSKIIVFHPDEWTNLNAPFLESVWGKFFQTEAYDVKNNYSPSTHVFWSNCIGGSAFSFHGGDWCKQYCSEYKIILDDLWHSNIEEGSIEANNVLTLRCKNWAWYNLSLWFTSLAYQHYCPQKTYQNSFLMLMHREKTHRDQIFNNVNLDDALFSYVEKGILIDGDMDHVDHWAVNFETAWYDNTAYSLVVETDIYRPTLVSEKTFKPLAHQHPFIVWGAPYTLRYLRELGFLTFPHIIDESYDTVLDDGQRLKAICEQVSNLSTNYKTIFDSPLTSEILKHNRNLFYDQSIQTRFEDEIIGQVLGFIGEWTTK